MHCAVQPSKLPILRPLRLYSEKTYWGQGSEEEECGGGSVVSCLLQRFTTKYACGHMSEIEEGRGGTVVRSLFLKSKNGHLTTILL